MNDETKRRKLTLECSYEWAKSFNETRTCPQKFHGKVLAQFHFSETLTGVSETNANMKSTSYRRCYDVSAVFQGKMLKKYSILTVRQTTKAEKPQAAQLYNFVPGLNILRHPLERWLLNRWELIGLRTPNSSISCHRLSLFSGWTIPSGFKLNNRWYGT